MHWKESNDPKNYWTKTHVELNIQNTKVDLPINKCQPRLWIEIYTMSWKTLNNRYLTWATQTLLDLFIEIPKWATGYNELHIQQLPVSKTTHVFLSTYIWWKLTLHSDLTKSWTIISHTPTADPYDPFFRNHKLGQIDDPLSRMPCSPALMVRTTTN